MKKIFIATILIAGLSTPAFAGHCPKDVKIIDEALPKATGLTEMQMTEVKALRDKGDALHKSGNHGESIKVLHEAIKILGVEPYKAM